MFPLLNVPFGTLDETRAQYHVAAGEFSSAYHPTRRAQYALAHWNAYLTHGDDEQKEAFMTHAHWLLAHESHLPNDASDWPSASIVGEMRLMGKEPVCVGHKCFFLLIIPMSEIGIPMCKRILRTPRGMICRGKFSGSDMVLRTCFIQSAKWHIQQRKHINRIRKQIR